MLITDSTRLQASRLIDSAVAAVPHPALALWDSTNSAFLIWFGVSRSSHHITIVTRRPRARCPSRNTNQLRLDDIGITVTQPKPPNVVELIMNTYFATLNQLLAAGAKRFIVMGAPRWYSQRSVEIIFTDFVHSTLARACVAK